MQPAATTQPKKGRILIAEDETTLRNLLQLSLTANNYDVICVEDGEKALQTFASESGKLDMLLLDIMMPRVDGFEVLREVRKVSDVPVVMLTALTSADEIVRGFDMGADDYITKPFVFREVSARIEAILRRVTWMKQPPPSPTRYRVGDLEVDLETHRVVSGKELCHLTPIEFGLLRYFLTHQEEVISKEDLFRQVWGYEFEGSTNLVEVGVRRLRAKIEASPSEPKYLHTVRGIGYRFQYADQTAS
ncbi:MAG: response regulator transcription factor [Caldilineales bacterium]|nr:response regulator transcription factor [Caldilineales bacterium]